MERNYLLNRSGKLYFRMKVPLMFRGCLAMREIKYRLNDKDLNVAEQKSRLLGNELSKTAGMMNYGTVARSDK